MFASRTSIIMSLNSNICIEIFNNMLMAIPLMCANRLHFTLGTNRPYYDLTAQGRWVRTKLIPMRIRAATWTFSAIMCSLLLLLPLILIFTQLVQPAIEWPHIFESLLADYMWNTCILVIAVNALALLFAAPAAWLTVWWCWTREALISTTSMA